MNAEYLFTQYKPFFDVLVSLTTIITAVVTMLTVREMKRQRQNMYMPNIFISNAWINLYGFDINNGAQSFTFLRKINVEKKWKFVDDTSNISNVIYVELNNIGFGTAKYIKCEWRYDYHRFFNLLESVNKNVFSVNSSKEENEWCLEIESKNMPHYTLSYYSKLYLDDEIDFISPASESKTIYEIGLPDNYCELLSYYLALKYDMFSAQPSKEFIYDQLTEIPPLTVKVEYYDIGNKQHIKYFKLVFSTHTNSTGNSYFVQMSNAVIATLSIKVYELDNLIENPITEL